LSAVQTSSVPGRKLGGLGHSDVQRPSPLKVRNRAREGETALIELSY